MVSFFINLVVFIISLALVVVIHEFGHFITAKIFNVYVNEFSVGFGPALFSYKKAGAETRFSLRAIPLGGYCSIVDGNNIEVSEEEMESLSELNKELITLNKTLPPERKLNNIAKWKKVIIMAAGVTLNFILGFILLFVAYLTVNVPTLVSNQVTVAESSLAYNANWSSDDIIVSGKYIVTIGGNETSKEFNSEENTTELYNAIVDSKSVAPTTLDDVIAYTLVTSEDKVISFTVPSKESNGTLAWDTLGVSFTYNYNEGTYHYTFGEAFINASKAWGEDSLAIFKALGTLFTKEGISQVGGVVQIFVVQEQVMNQGFAYVINLWALISINLGIMNLLPFPGLDGWHILVTIIEGITRKPLPEKFKTIMANVGMILLLALGVLIFFKDIISLF